MDQSGKIRQHRYKELSKVSKFETDMTLANEDIAL